MKTRVRIADRRRVVAVTLLVAATLPAQKTDLHKQVRDALDRARPVLLKKLRTAHGGPLALVCLAAIHDEVPSDHKTFVKAIKKLSRTKLSRTYDLSLRLIVMSEFAKFPKRREHAIRDKFNLLRNVFRRSGFGYHQKDNRWDLSNTQYAALGLRAAVSLGVEVKKRVWRGMLEAAISAQNDDGGFGYSTKGRRPTASMTAAGIAVLQLCADHLDDKTVVDLSVEKRLDQAWEWITDHKGDIGDKTVKNSFYFHYGLERASILSDVKDVDGKDWYRAGAEMFLRTQLEGGGWHSPVDLIHGGKDADGSDEVSTAFAILFLRRKFQKVLNGPITPGGGIGVSQLPAQATPTQIDTAVAAAVARGRAALPQVLRALRSKLKVRRVAAAKALFKISGQDFGFNPHHAPEKTRDAVKKAEMWFFKSGRAKGK